MKTSTLALASLALALSCGPSAIANNTLVTTAEEPAGGRCASGGVAILSGKDANGDGALTGNEIASTQYVCGATGTTGEAGARGESGADCQLIAFGGCPGADLQHAIIVGKHVQGIDLSGANLRAALVYDNLVDANLAGANLTAAQVINTTATRMKAVGSIWERTRLTAVRFEGADLSGASFAEARIEGVTSFAGANLVQANFTGALFTPDMAALRDTTLTGANFTHARLLGMDLSRAKLDGANFTGADLRGADFSDADVSNAVFTDAIYDASTTFPAGANVALAIDLSSNDLNGKNLAGAVFGAQDLSGRSFNNANLQGASFDGTTISGAFFTGADLRGADFQGVVWATNAPSFKNANADRTNFTGMHLGDSNITGAHFAQATLFSADFTSVLTDSATSFSGAYYNATTYWPGAVAAPAGAVQVDFATAAGKDLSNIWLRESNLAGMNFSATNFTGAFFSLAGVAGTNFSGANFSGARLTGLVFTSANLTNAIFTNANLEDSQLELLNLDLSIEPTLTGAHWESTRCPDRSLSNDNGGTCVGVRILVAL